jgi:predicted lipoprotein
LKASPKVLIKRLQILAVFAVLIVVVIWDTTFIGPEEALARGAAEFSAEEFAALSFPDLVELYEETAVDVAQVGAALRDDPEAGAEEFGNDLGSGRFGFALSATGEVSEVTEDFITIAIEDDPDLDVRVPLTTAVNGSPIRDATGTIAFGDFRDQTQYQDVANEFRLIVLDEVIAPLDLAGADGQEIFVVGAWLQGGPPDTFVIQPVRIDINP